MMRSAITRLAMPLSARLTRRCSSSISSSRSRLLQASLNEVPLHGWTHDAISAGVEKEDLPLSMLGMVTPTELVEWFMQDANQKFAKQLDSMKMDGMELPERLAAAIETRLKHVAPFRSNWHEGMALGATDNSLTTANQLEEIVQLISRKVVEGTDHAAFSQLERTAIGALYVATELHLLADESTNCDNTWDFLRGRINELHILAQQRDGSFLSGDTVIAATAVATSLAGAAVSLIQPTGQALMSSLLPHFLSMTTPRDPVPTGTSPQDYDHLPPFPTSGDEKK